MFPPRVLLTSALADHEPGCCPLVLLCVLVLPVYRCSLWRSFPGLAQPSLLWSAPQGRAERMVLQVRDGGHELLPGSSGLCPVKKEDPVQVSAGFAMCSSNGSFNPAHTTCREHPFNVLLKEGIPQRGKHHFTVPKKSSAIHLGPSASLVSGGGPLGQLKR